jgi:hypothetical protein
MSNAARLSSRKQGSMAFLAMKTGTSMKREMALMRNEERQIHSDIDEVRKALETTLAEVSQLVDDQPLRSTNFIQGAKTNISSADHSQEKATKTLNASVTNSTKSATSNSSKVAEVDKKTKVQAVLQAQGAILENLFKHLKGDIVNINEKESSSKEVSDKQIKHLQEQVKEDEAKMAQNLTLSKYDHAALVNKTKSDKIELQFWTHERNLGHQMFHTNLKMQHDLMNRVKSVIDVCKDAVTKGHVDQDLLKKIAAQAVPKAFLEMQSTVDQSAQQYYSQVIPAEDWAAWMASRKKFK